MRFDEKYPTAKAFGVFKDVAVGDTFGPCQTCQEWTYWYEVDDEVFVCSDECRYQWIRERLEGEDG